MRASQTKTGARPILSAMALACAAALCACAPSPPLGPASGRAAQMIDPADPLASAHDLSALGEYDLALRAFSQAALDQGLTPEILAGMGAANLGLGRLGQAEPLLRRAAEAEPAWPENLNNLGVVLLEQGKAGEAVQTLRRAYALDNGESDAIRNNLRLALATLENSDTVAADSGGYRLVRLGGGSFLLSTPQ